MIGIYKITSPRNKIYIGQSWNIDKRFNNYKYPNNFKSQPKLYNSIKKYGYENHKFDILEIFSDNVKQESIDEKETTWIKYYLTYGFQLLNVILSGRCGRRKPHTLKTKKLISEKHKGKILSSETKKKISLAFKGKSLLEETKKKMSLSKLGIKKPNIAKALKGRKLSKTHRDNMSKGMLGIGTKKIEQIFDENVVKEWASLTEASKALKINNGHISSVCRGKRKNAGGFGWKYEF